MKKFEQAAGVGPRKAKEAREAISTLYHERNRFIELSGTHGKPETERRTVLWEIGGSTTNHPLYPELWNEFGERFAWKITPENVHAVIQAAKEAHEKAVAGRPVRDARTTQAEDDKHEAWKKERDREYEEREAARRKTWDTLLNLAPTGAEAVILAHLEKNDCDAMTDYFATKREKTVAIGFRFGKKEDFRQLRKAAGSYEPTAHLGPDAPKEIEHRDNYSMGRGNYLKDGSRYCSGWYVQSYPLSWKQTQHIDEISIPENLPEDRHARTWNGETTDSVTITDNTEKNGVEIRFPGKPSQAVLDSLKSHGWRWSRFSGCWYKRAADGVREEAERLTA